MAYTYDNNSSITILRLYNKAILKLHPDARKLNPRIQTYVAEVKRKDNLTIIHNNCGVNI